MTAAVVGKDVSLSEPDNPSDSVIIADKVTLSKERVVSVKPLNCGLSDVDNPKEALAVFPDSVTKLEPSPTIKLPSLGVRFDISVSCASKA